MTSVLSEPEPSPPSLRERVAKGALWSLIGQVLGQGLTMAASVVAARLLGDTGYGEYGIITSTVGGFGVFAGMGLGATAIKYIAEYRDKDPERAGRIVALCNRVAVVSGLLTGVALLLSAPALASHTLHAPHLADVLRLSSGLLVFNALMGSLSGVLAGLEAYRTLAGISFWRGLVAFPLMVLGGWAYGLWGLVLGTVLASAAGWLLTQRAVKVECRKAALPLTGHQLSREMQVLWNFSLPACLIGVVTTPVIWACNALLVNQPGGYSQMGILNAATQIRSAAMFIPAAIFQPLLPILCHELNREDKSPGSLRLHIINAYATWFLATSATAILLYLAGPIMWLFGPDFVAGKFALVLVLCSIPLMTYKDGIGRLVHAKGLIWMSFGSNLLLAVVLLAATYVLAPQGAVGLGYAYLIAYAVNVVVMVPLFLRKLGMVRVLGMDAILAVLLGLALIPGVLSNALGLGLNLQIVSALVTLGMLFAAAWQLRRWLAAA